MTLDPELTVPDRLWLMERRIDELEKWVKELYGCKDQDVHEDVDRMLNTELAKKLRGEK